MRTRVSACVGVPAMLAVAALGGAYAALSTDPPPSHAAGSIIVLEPRLFYEDSCPPKEPSGGRPNPRPINPGSGMPLALDPATFCPDSTSFRVKVVGGDGFLVTRQERPWLGCYDYYGWDNGEEITSGCSGPNGDNLSGYADRQIFIHFYGPEPVQLVVQCGCNAENPNEPVGAEQTVQIPNPNP